MALESPQVSGGVTHVMIVVEARGILVSSLHGFGMLTNGHPEVFL
jgi:hypothetical protein